MADSRSNIGLLQAVDDTDQEIDEIIDDLKEWLDNLKKRKRRMNHHNHLHKDQPEIVEGDGRTVFLPGYGSITWTP